jgi:hypothetical protein
LWHGITVGAVAIKRRPRSKTPPEPIYGQARIRPRSQYPFHTRKPKQRIYIAKQIIDFENGAANMDRWILWHNQDNFNTADEREKYLATRMRRLEAKNRAGRVGVTRPPSQ